MNQKVVLLRSILEQNTQTQRALQKELHASLGSVNRLIRDCLADGSLREAEERAGEPDKQTTARTTVKSGSKSAAAPEERSAAKGVGRSAHAYAVTEEGLRFLEPYRVDRALILSAGFGSRFVPLSYETPKGLIEVFGEPMIERQLRQLNEAGVTDITIVVGYLKEQFEYLQDKFGVKLLYNPEYATKNNLASLYCAREFLSGHNCYVLSADNWLRENLYHHYEGDAWYCAAHADGDTAEWTLVTDRKGRITDTYPGGRDCDYMYGPVYFSREFSERFLPVLTRYYEMPGTEQYYWEHVLMELLNGQAGRRLTAYFGRAAKADADACENLPIYINLQENGVVYEFENLEELRGFDPRYETDSGSAAMQLVSRVFEAPESAIHRIRCLKAGMTNNSWLFELAGKSYICRIPGEGTARLINRREEKAAYEAVESLGIADRLIYFDAESGYKISRYYENARTADPMNRADMSACMRFLKKLHNAGLHVHQHFDLGERISDYETLCRETADTPAAIPYQDYEKVRAQKEVLLVWLSKKQRPQTLCHIDSVADNFLFLQGSDLSETERDLSRLRLIDWEYAAMCDPLVDVAMCAIYSYMEETAALELLSFYLDREPDREEKQLLFAYMALGGLLWALWGVYKEHCGVLQFSDYTIRMYRYFKVYAKKVLSEAG